MSETYNVWCAFTPDGLPVIETIAPTECQCGNKASIQLQKPTVRWPRAVSEMQRSGIRFLPITIAPIAPFEEKPMEISFEVKRRNLKELDIARMVAEVIGEQQVWEDEGLGVSHGPYDRDGKWQLDSANNWFLHKTDEGYTLSYRYHTPARQTGLIGLRAYLEAFIFNEP